MAKGKVRTVAIKLLSTAGTGYFYVTTKNPRNVARKLSLSKVLEITISHFVPNENVTLHSQYDPIVRQHVLFNETKLK
jgi:large subunit ribosomal protein L33